MSKTVTDLYDNIWNNFDKEMVDEAVQLLSTRLKRNKVSLNLIKNKIVLDDGCGSGRYSIALKKLGAKRVIGLDKGKGKKLKYKGIEYVNASVLKLPFKDNTFDFVFCNGVLHHTNNTKQGIREIHRVLKPNSYMWLYLAAKSKIFNEMDKIRRKHTLGDSRIFKKILELYQFPKQKQFLLTDILFVKIRHYFTRKGVTKLLKNIGFKDIRFLERGVDFDFNERMYYNPELKEWFGDGDLRFTAKKNKR